MVQVIGVPFDLCGRMLGSRMGPAALRAADIIKTPEHYPWLVDLNETFVDLGDVFVDSITEDERRAVAAGKVPGIKHFGRFLSTMTEIQQRVGESLVSGATPLVIGGDHSLSIGSVSAALHHFKGDLAVLWIDAHADLNSPGTTDSGNLHGMSMAALLGMPSEIEDPLKDGHWNEILRRVGPKFLEPHCAGWLGLRDLDPDERRRLLELPQSYRRTMHGIDRFGLTSAVENLDTWLRSSGAKHLWISFDVDTLDPVLAPGTGTAVRGGLTYREAHLLAELLREFLDHQDCPYRLVGLDVVETNPVVDSNNETGKVVVEWVDSLLGKSILGGGL